MRSILPWALRVIGCLVCVAHVGCGDANQLGSVVGAVQFRGQSVTEGFVTLYSSELGVGMQIAINGDGAFRADGLQYGPYRIAVLPPEVREEYGGRAAPAMVPKDVKNIPRKYRDSLTSGFSCMVDGPKVQVDLQMD